MKTKKCPDCGGRGHALHWTSAIWLVVSIICLFAIPDMMVSTYEPPAANMAMRMLITSIIFIMSIVLLSSEMNNPSGKACPMCNGAGKVKI